MSKPRLVLFLGAGFSASAGFPTMAELPSCIRVCDALDETERHDLDLVVSTVNELAGIEGQNPRNLEVFASHLHMLSITRPDYEFQGAIRIKSPESALRTLRKAVRAVLDKPIPNTAITTAAGFFRLAQSSELTVVTTNYDAFCEVASRGAACSAIAVGTNSDISPPLLHPSHPVIPLCKLHGSVTWGKRQGSAVVCSDISTGMVAQPNGQEILSTYHGFCQFGDPNSHPEGLDIDYWVLPTHLKGPPQDLIAIQWSTAAKAIAEADRLWFVGYSFPESDAFMRFFLAAALHRNSRLSEIVVVNPDETVVEKAAARLFTAPHLRSIYLGLPVIAEELNPAALFVGNHKECVDRRRVDNRMARQHELSTIVRRPRPRV